MGNVRAITRDAAKRGVLAAAGALRRSLDREAALQLLAPHVVADLPVEPVTSPPSTVHGRHAHFSTATTSVPPHGDLVHVVAADAVDVPLRLTRNGGLRLGTALPDLDFGTGSGLLDVPGPLHRRVPGDVVSPWSHHWGGQYYDWTVMVLGKLLRIEEVLGPERFARATILLRHHETRFARWYLGAMGVLDRVVDPRPGLPIAPERAVVGPSQPWFRPSRRDLLRLRGRFLHDRPGPGLGHRLYLQRRGRRRVVNERELLPVLRRHGVQVVPDGRYDVGEQIALFRDAELVVAPHGAGLTNLVWSSPGTQVLELFSTGYAPDCFRHLCAVLGHDHHAILHGPAGAESTWDNVGQDVVVEPRVLDRALAEIG